MAVNIITTTKNPKYDIQAVKVFPNPFRDKALVIVEGDILKQAYLQLLNMEGKLIKTIRLSSQNTFEVSREDLPNNIYLFKIMEDEEWVASGKLVVQ